MNTLDVGRELSKHFDAAMLSRGRPRFDLDEIPLVAPDSIEGFVEAIRFAASEKLCIVPTGLGSKLGWCAPPTRAHFMLSTRRLKGVVSHVPDDGTIAVRAGTTMSELARIVESGGHRLTPDVPRPEHCTIGGVVAAGESGADRLRFGPVRHHVLGLKVLLADGTIAKCGGQLVKNVTGFDLMKLYTGSHGTLCVILEVALRLFPAPEEEVWLSIEIPHGRRFDFAERTLALPIRLTSLSQTDGEDRTATAKDTLHARVFGKRETVAAECEQLLAAWPGAQVLRDVAARSAANELRDAPCGAGTLRPSLHSGCARSDLLGVVSGVCYDGDDFDIRCRWVAQPGIAEIDFELSSDEPERLKHAVGVARSWGDPLAFRNAPSAALVGLDPFGDEPIGLDLMRDLKRALDPNGVFASGRFVGGI